MIVRFKCYVLYHAPQPSHGALRHHSESLETFSIGFICQLYLYVLATAHSIFNSFLPAFQQHASAY